MELENPLRAVPDRVIPRSPSRVHQHPGFVFCIYFSSFIVLLLNLAPGVDASDYKNVYLESDEDVSYQIPNYYNDKTLIDVKIRGGPVDIYVMSSIEYEELYPNETFQPSKAFLNTTHENFIWEDPDDQRYLLIIDNRNNSHENDTIPNGSVRYDLLIDSSYDSEVPEFEGIFEDSTTVCMVGAIFLVIIIIAFVVILAREKSQQPLVPPPLTNLPYSPPHPPYSPPHPPNYSHYDHPSSQPHDNTEQDGRREGPKELE